MTKTVDVAAGQKVASAWGNEIRDRTLQVFATPTERDAQWPAASAPAGSHCVTVDTNVWWRAIAGVWVPVAVGSASSWATVNGSAATGIGGLTTVIATGAIAGVPYDRDVQLAPVVQIAVDGAGASSTFEMLLQNAGATIAQATAIPLASVGQTYEWMPFVVHLLPANTGANYQVNVRRSAGAATVRTYADGTINRMSWRATARS